jgi:hypothetical protein
MPLTVIRKRVSARVALLLLSTLLVSLAVVHAQKFHVEPGARKAGTEIVPVIKVTAVKDKQVYDTVEADDLRYGIKLRGLQWLDDAGSNAA